MLALKKKREAEAKAKAEAEAAAAAAPPSGQSSSNPTSEPAASSSASSSGKLSLFGIDGKKKANKSAESGGKKKTPGEIRIQKGMWKIYCCCGTDFWFGSCGWCVVFLFASLGWLLPQIFLVSPGVGCAENSMFYGVYFLQNKNKRNIPYNKKK
mmetsp:Transcript_41317/g.62644  ORF Transcript_41317/g.62644 Transcript_41317/m.62644 type:complete len:154 (+) Transcript_41317:130-591(+)